MSYVFGNFRLMKSGLSAGIFLLMSTFCPVIAGEGLAAENAYSRSGGRISVQIVPEKKELEAGEKLEGKVIVKSGYPASVPAVFLITLYHDGTYVSQMTTSVRIPYGTTKFSFRDFGIPDFSREAGAEGEWRITIVQQNRDPSEAASVTVRVVSPPPKPSN